MRKNRIILEDSWYHLVTRVHARERLLNAPVFKDCLAEWIDGVAGFSGIDVGSWCVMDNHLHLFVRAPSVPERYWTTPGVAPDTCAFTMRPPETPPLRWAPTQGSTSAGDRPSSSGPCTSEDSGSEDSPANRLPPVGFTLPDDEMIARLAKLRGAKSAKASAARWARLRDEGQGPVVEAEKERLCRRMYNVSQFMKTLKQRITEQFNRRTGHTGTLWEGRFWSKLAEPDTDSCLAIGGYIALNPVRARIVDDPSEYCWSSYAVACGDGPLAETCRRGYEKMLGRPWEESRHLLEAMFAEKLPAILEGKSDILEYDVADENGGTRKVALTVAQAIHMRQRTFSHGYVFAKSEEYIQHVVRSHPAGFRLPSFASDRQLQKLNWKTLAA